MATPEAVAGTVIPLGKTVKFTPVFVNQPGWHMPTNPPYPPLPPGIFTASGGRVLIAVSGSGYSSGSVIGIEVGLNGVPIGTCKVNTNGSNHAAFVPLTLCA